MGYVVTAGFVTVETAVPGGRAQVDIPRGAPLPADVPAETVATLLARGDVAAAAKPDEVPVPDEVPDGAIDVVLAWVGEDLDRARRALDAEQAEGGKNRKGVVDPLTDLLTRP